MPTEIPKQYDPAASEAQWFPFWEARGDFNADPDLNPDPEQRKPPHVIMIPLPNVTGALHMGHALNGTIQDLLTRWRRMQGYVALWMPGTDHAGIATQAVVERRMKEQENLTRHDIGRDALVQRIWKWKDEYEKRILGQLKRLGASCDWRRVRFTLDDVCSKAVRRTFFKMFKDGLIYRGKRLVNWDTFLQTAVADDEVYTEDVAGKFWTFHYPVVDASGAPTGRHISFSTTRPETMLGDTAVCVHPTDERYLDLIGQKVQIPLNGRLIPIIADALLADKDLGTGCVKVTPAHDPNDYACWTRNKEKMGDPINLLNPDGTFNENAGAYAGLDRLAVRDAVVTAMEQAGCFEKVEDRQIPLKFSDRSKTAIEPYLSDQWFVKMDELATKAVDAVKNRDVEFFPERYANSYLDWLEEKRDWCISRQLWWGHRIPIWSQKQTFLSEGTEDPIPFGVLAPDQWPICMGGASAFNFRPEWSDFVSGAIVPGDTANEINLLVCVDEGHPEIEQLLQSNGFTQDEDVLDTWFSSALWPHATLGWPDLEHNPPMVDAIIDRSASEGGHEHLQRLGSVSAAELHSAKSLIEDTLPLRSLAGAEIPAEVIGCIREDWARKHQAIPLEFQSDTLVIAFATEVDPERIDAIRFHTNREIKVVLATAEDVAVAIDRHYGASKDKRTEKTQGSESLGFRPPTNDQQPTTNAVLNYFYPGSVLVTSRDIITLWVARMVLTGLYNMGDVPFKHVHVHPKILDGFGQGMSKSKGNGVDPLDLIGKYGADGLRFTIASLAGETQDVRLPISYACPHCDALIPQTAEHQKAKPKDGKKPRVKCPKCKKESQYTSPNYDPDPGEPVASMVSERFEYGRNFCNKLWNACRFALINLEGYTPGPVTDADLALEDRWILSRLATVTDEVTRLLDKYQFDQATRALREFVWNEFCDWYLEMIKPRLRLGDDETINPLRANCQRVLVTVVDTILRLLHPFTPFITEDLWQRLNEIAPERPAPSGRGSLDNLIEETLGPDENRLAPPVSQPSTLNPQSAAAACIIAPWPTGLERFRDSALETRFQRLQDLIGAVRNLRGVYNISPTAILDVYIRCQPDVAADLDVVAEQFGTLAKNRLVECGPNVTRPPASASFSLGEADGYVPLEGLIDRTAELARQQKEAEKIRGFIAGHEKKLTNTSFVERAPAEVVQEIRDTLVTLRKQLASTEDVIQQLGG